MDFRIDQLKSENIKNLNSKLDRIRLSDFQFDYGPETTSIPNPFSRFNFYPEFWPSPSVDKHRAKIPFTFLVSSNQNSCRLLLLLLHN